MSDSDKQTIVELGKKLGREVEFSEDFAADEDGRYEDGKLILNANQINSDGMALVNVARSVYIHELVHSFENTGSYSGFSDYVIAQTEKLLKKSGRTMQELYAAKRAQYGDRIKDDAEARREIVAEYAQRYLFTDEASVKRLVNQKPDLASRALLWIQYQIKQLGARISGNPEHAALLEAERLYIKAFAESKKSPSEAVRRSQNAVDSGKKLRDNITNKGGLENGGAESEGESTAGPSADGRGAGDFGRPASSAESASAPGVGVVGQGDSSSNNGLLSYEYRERLTKAKVPDFGLSSFNDPRAYSEALSQMRSDNIEGASVDPKTPQELSDCRLILSEDRTVGAAIQPNGNIVAVFKNRAKNKKKDAGIDLIINAVAMGGDRLDCYGAFLANTYAYGCMEPVARVQYARGMNPEMDAYIDAMRKEGKPGFATDPDVYFMKLRDGVSIDDVVAANENNNIRCYTQADLDGLKLFEDDADGYGYDKAEAYRDSLIDKKKSQYAVSSGDFWKDFLGTDDENSMDGRTLYAISPNVQNNADPFTALIDKYGAKPQGKNPRARDIDVPDKVSEEETVSLFTRSLFESGLLTDDMLDDVRQKVAAGDYGVYTATTDAAELASADQKIADLGGIASAQEFFLNAVKTRSIKLTDANVMVAMGMRLANEAAACGDGQSMMDIASSQRNQLFIPLPKRTVRPACAGGTFRAGPRFSPSGLIYGARRAPPDSPSGR